MAGSGRPRPAAWIRWALPILLIGLMAPTSAYAEGGKTIATAPSVVYGQQEFGNTALGAEYPEKGCGFLGGGTYRDQFWLLNATAGDLVTINWGGAGELKLRLYPIGTTDYTVFNYETVAEQEPNGNGKNQLQYAVPASGVMPLEFAVCSFGDPDEEPGPYSFMITAQHGLAVSLPPTPTISINSTVSGSAALASGAAVPDGMVFTLTATWGNGTASYTAASVGGSLAFPLALPADTEGKQVTLTLSRPADAQYLAPQTAEIQTQVAQPPTPPVGTASVARTGKVRHGAALLTLTCTGGPCKGGFKLRAHYKEHRVVHRHGVRRVSVHQRIAVVGRSAFSVPANQATTLAVPLSRKGKELLHRSKRQRLRVKLAGHGINRATITLQSGSRHHGKRKGRGRQRLAFARASSTKQQCIARLLQPPRVTKAVMYNPGSHANGGGVGGQEILVNASYGGVKGCGAWKRLGKFREQIKQSGRWVNLGGNFWYPSGIPSQEGNEAHEVGFMGVPTNGIYDRCVHGHRQPARVQFRNAVKSNRTGKIVAVGRIKNQGIKIEPSASC